MSSIPAVDITPWYRQRWPWLIMVPPAAAVIGCIITITLAIKSADGVVAADYYKRGLAINEQLARSDLAHKLGLQAEVVVGGITAGDAIAVRLAATQALPPEAALKLRLVHPGRGGADREAILSRVAVHDDGRSVEYRGQWGDNGSAPIAGHVNWRLVMEARDWRLDGDASMLAPARTLRVSATQP